MIFWKYPSLGGLEYVSISSSTQVLNLTNTPLNLIEMVMLNPCIWSQIVHHSLSGVAVAYSLFSGEGQLYTYMVLISEITTPEINLRWYLPSSFFSFFPSTLQDFHLSNLSYEGTWTQLVWRSQWLMLSMASSSSWLGWYINILLILMHNLLVSTDRSLLTFSCQVARILLFIYMFYHVYLHYNQVKLIISFSVLSSYTSRMLPQSRPHWIQRMTIFIQYPSLFCVFMWLDLLLFSGYI